MIKQGMVLFDIGANIGFMSLIAARLVGAGGKVLCFEPLRKTKGKSNTMP